MGYSSAHPSLSIFFFLFVKTFHFHDYILTVDGPSRKRVIERRVRGERNTISNDSSAWFFIISWRHVLLWIIAWLWSLMGSLKTHNSSKIFIACPSPPRMHCHATLKRNLGFQKDPSDPQNVQDLLTDWPFNKITKTCFYGIKMAMENTSFGI